MRNWSFILIDFWHKTPNFLKSKIILLQNIHPWPVAQPAAGEFEDDEDQDELQPGQRVEDGVALVLVVEVCLHHWRHDGLQRGLTKQRYKAEVSETDDGLPHQLPDQGDILRRDQSKSEYFLIGPGKSWSVISLDKDSCISVLKCQMNCGLVW